MDGKRKEEVKPPSSLQKWRRLKAWAHLEAQGSLAVGKDSSSLEAGAGDLLGNTLFLLGRFKFFLDAQTSTAEHCLVLQQSSYRKGTVRTAG